MDKGFIFALVFALLVGLFALSNSEKVVIDFILTNVVISQALVILISALLGALTIFIMGFFKNMKLKKEIKMLKKEINSLNKENNLMKSLIEENTEQEKERQLLELKQSEENIKSEE